MYCSPQPFNLDQLVFGSGLSTTSVPLHHGVAQINKYVFLLFILNASRDLATQKHSFIISECNFIMALFKCVETILTGLLHAKFYCNEYSDCCVFTRQDDVCCFD